MATNKTIAPTGVTVQIPGLTDAPDMSVPANAIDKAIDGINTLNSQIDYSRQLTSSDDLNTVANGTYYFNSGNVPSHSPATNNSIVETVGGGQKFQKVTTASGGIVYEYNRRYYGGSWSDWTSTIVNTQVVLNNVNSVYFDKSTNSVALAFIIGAQRYTVRFRLDTPMISLEDNTAGQVIWNIT